MNPGAPRATSRPSRFDAFIDRLLIAGRIIPPRFAWWLGGALGECFSRLPVREARRCREHLRKAFPERGAAWSERAARRTFRHFGSMSLWTIATLTIPPQRLRRGIMVEGADNLRELVRACRRGEGTVGLTGHFGNWELLARIGATLMPLTVVGRRLRSPLADRLVQGARTASGARLVYQDDDLRAFARELRAGRVLATLVDQDIPRLAGTFVPWFGDLAYTPSGPAALALLTRSSVQPVFLSWRGGRWVFHTGPRRKFPRSGDTDADANAITAWATTYEERLVARAPHQWVWWHLRWRTRPEDRPLSRRANPGGKDAADANSAGH